MVNTDMVTVQDTDMDMGTDMARKNMVTGTMVMVISLKMRVENDLNAFLNQSIAIIGFYYKCILKNITFE